MITGRVTERNEAILSLTVVDDDGRERDFIATLDTGFTGYLALSPTLLDQMHLQPRVGEDVILADGSITSLAVYRVTIIWEDEERTVPAFAMNSRSSARRCFVPAP